LSRFSAGGNTALYDAAYASLLRERTESSRSLVLIFSDGADTSSWLKPSLVQDAALRSESVVYAVAALARAERPMDPLMRQRRGRWRAGDLPPRPRTINDFLTRMTTATGGRLLHANDDALAASFANIMREFQNRYLLTYVPTTEAEKPGWHDITVHVKRRGVRVEARRGYWR
jgi:VWFA-related protein